MAVVNSGVTNTISKNNIRDLVFTTLSIQEKSKIPVLFLGNPGIAKTTGVRLWAKEHGYKVTTLIGTQRVAEEILGYMVNEVEQKKLVTYTPDWFDEIIKNHKEGHKTLLFIDELSQAPENVQGAMLQLIFDRRVGGTNNYLPDDTLIVSAANYKGNIPLQCNIQAPTLNRFVIININPKDSISLVQEFLQPEENRTKDLPEFSEIELTAKMEESIRRNLERGLLRLFVSMNEVLDFQNTEFNDIFDSEGEVYNFITGRTISYTFEVLKAMVQLGITQYKFADVIRAHTLGLLGAGTCNFTSPLEKKMGTGVNGQKK
ncbi:MAG: AAA family ATPase [Treponemataceae bacterium]